MRVGVKTTPDAPYLSPLKDVWGDSTYVARRVSKKPHQLIDFLLFFGIFEKTAFVTSKNKQQQMYKTNDANLKRKTNIVLDRLVSEKR